MKKLTPLILALLICATACGNHPAANQTIESTAAPTVKPTLAHTPTATITATPSPAPPVLPLALPAEAQDFRDDILVIGSIRGGFDEYEGGFMIFIGEGRKDGEWLDAVDFNYKGVTGMEYIYYLNDKGYSEYPEPDEFDFYDATDYYFESELLNGNMTFHVYDGEKYLGTGRITDAPYFVTYYHEAFLWAGFAMDDPSAKLDPEKAYSANNVGFCSSTFYPDWNDDADQFTMQISENMTVKGRIYEVPYENYPDQTEGKVDVYWKRKTYTYDIGNMGSFLDVTSPYSDGISFADVDGDGILEMIVYADYAGGWNQVMLSFGDSGVRELLWQGGRY